MKHTYTNLGILTQEQKEHIWKHQISGSQIKRLYEDPITLFKEKIGEVEPEPFITTEIIRLKMEMGNYMEDIIIDLAKEKYRLDVIIDKSTFQSNDFPLRTANIDGYIKGEDGGIDYIVEVKNTEVENIQQLVDRYLPQLTYYISFFNAKKGGIFLFFINGYNLIKVTIERDESKIVELDSMLDVFENAMIMEIPPVSLIKKDNQIEVVVDITTDTHKELNDTIKEFIEIKEYIKNAEIREEELKEELSKLHNGKAKILASHGYLKLLPSFSGGRVDYKSLCWHLAEQFNLDIIALEKAFTAEKYPYMQVRVYANKKDNKNE